MDTQLDNLTLTFKRSPLQHLKLADLVLDAGTQQRANMNKDVIENYASAMVNDSTTEKFPPLQVVELTDTHTLDDGSVLEKGAKLLVDGFHRSQAALESGFDSFQVVMAQGSYMDAVYFSMQANKSNGLHLGSKDYQNAIRRLYKMSPAWREHGRKQEIAKLFGCSTKTVQRAVSSIDKEIKAKAFKMFDMGAVDSYVAEYAHKDVVTIQRWRVEWEEMKQAPEETPEETLAEQTVVPSDPMDYTFKQVLCLHDINLKADLLQQLVASLDADKAALAYNEEPKVVSEDILSLATTWQGQTCWEILGKDFNSILACKNPRGALQRQYTLQLSKCETEDGRANPAMDILNAVYEEAKGFLIK